MESYLIILSDRRLLQSPPDDTALMMLSLTYKMNYVSLEDDKNESSDDVDPIINLVFKNRTTTKFSCPSFEQQDN